jgi:hypothetical protein
MLKKTLFGFGLVLVVIAVSACTTFKVSGAQVTTEIPSYTSVGEFEIVVNVNEFLGNSGGSNLFNVSADKMDPAIYDAIQREIRKYTADAAVNVTIEYKAKFTDILLNGLTLGIWAPAHAYVSGTVIKYQ